MEMNPFSIIVKNTKKGDMFDLDHFFLMFLKAMDECNNPLPAKVMEPKIARQIFKHMIDSGFIVVASNSKVFITPELYG
jgi:hypothetical protein